ncbi:hypothetical protein ACM71F_30430 [Pseudomonas aeruginosa]|uniref:hypothetical protein n=1 Tax=Pseudomonas aeruginosa TaxID=287 RepID=UPI0011BF9703|nr:hypothetical protein [Pseudomonas aeruginosa]HBP1360096.1 hypothetical protein [Pseudomonas aeruginosa]HCD6620099.1 hypothetical protein [Pseudomonas aeruginosa]HCF5954695.1 hypothetical protein [Pseudomonas aeruginosa]HCK4905099.1 hypothetical protein [Pseudomonas aeruginosa]
MSKLQHELCKQIIKSWLSSRSNYIVVAPPMSGEPDFISQISKRELGYEVLADKYRKFSIACLDSANFRNDLDFACKVSSSWGVPRNAAGCDDAVSVLESACDDVLSRGLEPILIIQRFHDALERLGESIGTALRNLEHTHRLKTVVTMPVRLTTLRERWEIRKSETAPFLASDWGQGHTTKLLYGYTKEELEPLVAGNDAKSQAEILYKATAGYKQIVDRLAEDIRGKNNRGLEAYLRSKSTELCERLVSWIEAPNSSHAFKKALVKLEHPGLYPSAAELIACHDWAASLIGKDGSLSFKMVAWACQDFLARQPGYTWLPDLTDRIKKKDAGGAIAIVNAIMQLDGINKEHWECISASLSLTQLGDNFFSDDEDWAAPRLKIERLAGVLASLPKENQHSEELSQWSSLFSFLEDYQLHKRTYPESRLERFVCDTDEPEAIPMLLQLLSLRLSAALDFTAFQGIQSVLTMPESILQVYGFKKYNLMFWDFQGLEHIELGEFKKFVGYNYRLEGKILGHSDLAHLVAFRSSKSPGSIFISDREKLSFALRMYDTRKELAHSTAFASSGECRSYQEYCLNLLNDAKVDLDIKKSEISLDLFYSISEILLKEVHVL